MVVGIVSVVLVAVVVAVEEIVASFGVVPIGEVVPSVVAYSILVQIVGGVVGVVVVVVATFVDNTDCVYH